MLRPRTGQRYNPEVTGTGWKHPIRSLVIRQEYKSNMDTFPGGGLPPWKDVSPFLRLALSEKIHWCHLKCCVGLPGKLLVAQSISTDSGKPALQIPKVPQCTFSATTSQSPTTAPIPKVPLLTVVLTLFFSYPDWLSPKVLNVFPEVPRLEVNDLFPKSTILPEFQLTISQSPTTAPHFSATTR